MNTRVLALLALFIPVWTVAPAATWYVRTDGSGGAATIQGGIARAVDGDTVLVAAGTYNGVGNFDINFLGKAIVVIAEDGPGNTIIDCRFQGRGVVFRNGEGPGSVLSGFTITHGSKPAGQGGGIFCDGASPEIKNNILVGNLGTLGGGIYLKKSDADVHNNTLFGNTSGIAVQNGAPTISNNIVMGSVNGEGLRCLGNAAPMLLCNNIFANAGGDALCGIDAGGNVSLDPQFCGIAGSTNFYLQGDSPCAAFNSFCGQLIGALPVLCATTPVENRTWGALKSLYR